MPPATPADAGHPNLVPTKRVSLQFAPSDVPLLRTSIPNFEEVLSNNAQSAYNLGLSEFNPSRPFKTKASSSKTARAREPYMTRTRTARLHVDDSGERAHIDDSGGASPQDSLHDHSTTSTSSSTAAGPHQGTTTSRTA